MSYHVPLACPSEEGSLLTWAYAKVRPFGNCTQRLYIYLAHSELCIYMYWMKGNVWNEGAFKLWNWKVFFLIFLLPPSPEFLLPLYEVLSKPEKALFIYDVGAINLKTRTLLQSMGFWSCFLHCCHCCWASKVSSDTSPPPSSPIPSFLLPLPCTIPSPANPRPMKKSVLWQNQVPWRYLELHYPLLIVGCQGGVSIPHQYPRGGGGGGKLEAVGFLHEGFTGETGVQGVPA